MIDGTGERGGRAPPLDLSRTRATRSLGDLVAGITRETLEIGSVELGDRASSRARTVALAV